jgi:tetratricopeptide (TPR) repeat protein
MKQLCRLVFFLIFLLLSVAGYSQQSKTDSLALLARTAPTDTARINYMMDIAWEHSNTNCDSAILISTQILYKINTLLLENHDKGIMQKVRISEGLVYHQLGVFNHLKSDYFMALQNYQKAMEIWTAIELLHFFGEPEKFKSQILYRKAKTTGNLGITKWAQGDYPKALDFFIKALKISEEEGNKTMVAQWLGNIGIIYYEQQNYAKALEFYFRAMKISEDLNDQEGISTQQSKIGVVYKDQKNYQLALDYFFKALKITTEIGDYDGTAILLGNIGAAYVGLYDLSKGMEYYIQALKMDEEVGNKNGILRHLRNIGMVYTIQKKFHEAEICLLEALAMAKDIGSLGEIRDAHLFLSDMYSEKKNYEKALEHYKEFSLLTDSLFNDEKEKELTRHEMTYDFEKKEAALKAEQVKKSLLEVADKERQEVFFWLVCAVAIAIALIAILVFRALSITRRQKNIIETQKEMVEEKQKEVLASIHYALRIQLSLLPSEKYIEKNMNRLKKNI